jgi:hypothetical protein
MDIAEAIPLWHGEALLLLLVEGDRLIAVVDVKQ